MKKLLILSGKGGTGKTSLTAAFAHLAAQSEYAGQVTLADTDVDAANLGLILNPKRIETTAFDSGQTAEINYETCISCGTCLNTCRFEAISFTDSKYIIDPTACEGCAACFYQCPTKSISMQPQSPGKIFVSESRFGKLFHAHLFAGQENSGKLVSQVKQMALQNALDNSHEMLLIDGPPGIGCPVISAITGVDLALIITEPTAAGAQDMNRALDTASHFGIPVLVCINKADLYPDGTHLIEQACALKDVQTIGRIPYDRAVTKAMIIGKAITEYLPDSATSHAILKIWGKVSETLFEDIKVKWIQ